MRRVTVDSSVIVSSLLTDEPRHREALKIWEDIIKGNLFAIMPFTVLVEVVAAIRRRTGSSNLAVEVKEEILKTENVSFVITDDDAAIQAADIAV